MYGPTQETIEYCKYEISRPALVINSYDFFRNIGKTNRTFNGFASKYRESTKRERKCSATAYFTLVLVRVQNRSPPRSSTGYSMPGSPCAKIRCDDHRTSTRTSIRPLPSTVLRVRYRLLMTRRTVAFGDAYCKSEAFVAGAQRPLDLLVTTTTVCPVFLCNST